jgi:hypothetical protein
MTISNSEAASRISFDLHAFGAEDLTTATMRVAVERHATFHANTHSTQRAAGFT